MTTEKLINEILDQPPMPAGDDTTAELVLEGMRHENFFTELVLAAEKRGRVIDTRMLAQLVDEFSAVIRRLRNEIAELQPPPH